jgi:hypothetical protein
VIASYPVAQGHPISRHPKQGFLWSSTRFNAPIGVLEYHGEADNQRMEIYSGIATTDDPITSR